MLNDAFSDPRTRGPATWTAGALTRRTFARWNVKARQTMSTTPVCQGRQRSLHVAIVFRLRARIHTLPGSLRFKWPSPEPLVKTIPLVLALSAALAASVAH